MSRYLFLSLCVFFSVAQADEKTSANNAHDLAYSLGASLGERLRQEVPDLQLQALLEGLQQAYQGKPLALKDEQIDQILAEHEAQIAEQPALPQSEAALEKEQRFLTEEKAKPGVRELADGVLLTELTPGTGAKAGPERQGPGFVCRAPAGWHGVRSEQSAAVVQSRQRDQRLAQRTAKHAGRCEMAPGDSIVSGLWRGGCRRPDRTVHTAGI